MTYYKLLNSHLRIKLNNYYYLDNDGRLVDHFRYHNIIIFIMYNREVPTIPSQQIILCTFRTPPTGHNLSSQRCTLLRAVIIISHDILVSLDGISHSNNLVDNICIHEKHLCDDKCTRIIFLLYIEGPLRSGVYDKFYVYVFPDRNP